MVSPDVMVAAVALVAVVEMDEVVSFRMGGDADGVWRPTSPGLIGLWSVLGGASARLGAGCIL